MRKLWFIGVVVLAMCSLLYLGNKPSSKGGTNPPAENIAPPVTVSGQAYIVTNGGSVIRMVQKPVAAFDPDILAGFVATSFPKLKDVAEKAETIFQVINQIPGKRAVASTDIDGKFSIRCREGDIVIVGGYRATLGGVEQYAWFEKASYGAKYELSNRDALLTPKGVLAMLAHYARQNLGMRKDEQFASEKIEEQKVVASATPTPTPAPTPAPSMQKASLTDIPLNPVFQAPVLAHSTPRPAPIPSSTPPPNTPQFAKDYTLETDFGFKRFKAGELVRVKQIQGQKVTILVDNEAYTVPRTVLAGDIR